MKGRAGPVTLPTVTPWRFHGEAQGVTTYARQFSGRYAHRILAGIGHNVPQEAPQAFAEAVIEVDGY